jgi:hypothetical protein
MAEITARTQLQFEPGTPAPVPMDAAAVAYTTPAAHREKLGDFARLRFVNGEARYKLTTSAGDASGVAEIRLTDGVSIIAAAVVELQAGITVYSGRMEADLTMIKGNALLRFELDVTTPAGAGVTGSLVGLLDISSPMVITGSC